MNEDIITKNWEKIKEYIREEYQLSNISYTTWIEKLELVKASDNVITIGHPSGNPFILSYLEKNFTDPFRFTISEMFNDSYDVRFILMEARDASPAQEEPSSSLNAAFVNAGLNPKYRFDTFIVGGNNRFAQSAALAVSESPGNTYNPLFLYGGAGLGKTHLMHSIGHYILEQTPTKKVLYVNSETFTNEVIESIRSGNAASMSRLRDKYRTVDVLLIDDIQFIIGKESTQEEFFHTFNELHQAGKQIVLSSDRPPREMDTLDERFLSRFEWGLIADVTPPDYETRMAILKKNAASTGRRFDDEVLNYIATNIKSNIRELEGAINKIIAFSRLNKMDLNLDTAREALKDIVDPEGESAVTAEQILHTVCEHYGVKTSAVISRNRSSEFVIPRQVIMYLCRSYLDMPLKEVATLLGKKDHSTVIYGVDKIKSDIHQNDELRQNVDIIMKKLNIQS